MQAPKIRKPFIVIPVISTLSFPPVRLGELCIRKSWPVPMRDQLHVLEQANEFRPRYFWNNYIQAAKENYGWMHPRDILAPAEIVGPGKSLPELDDARTNSGKYALQVKARDIAEKLETRELAVFVGFHTAIIALIEPHDRELCASPNQVANIPNAAYLVMPNGGEGVPLVSQIVTPHGEFRRTPALQALLQRWQGPKF